MAGIVKGITDDITIGEFGGKESASIIIFVLYDVVILPFLNDLAGIVVVPAKFAMAVIGAGELAFWGVTIAGYNGFIVCAVFTPFINGFC